MVELPGCRLELFSWKDIKVFICLSVRISNLRQKNRQTDGQMDRQTNGQLFIQTNRRTLLISFQRKSASLQPGSSTMKLYSSNVFLGLKI